MPNKLKGLNTVFYLLILRNKKHKVFDKERRPVRLRTGTREDFQKPGLFNKYGK